jgi:hypothetical protein
MADDERPVDDRDSNDHDRPDGDFVDDAGPGADMGTGYEETVEEDEPRAGPGVEDAFRGGT